MTEDLVSVSSVEGPLAKYALDKSARRDAFALFLIVLGATTIIVALQSLLLPVIDVLPIPFLDSFGKRMLMNILAYVGLMVVLIVFFVVYDSPSFEALGLTTWKLPLVLIFGFVTTIGFPIVMLVSSPIMMSFFPLPAISSPEFLAIVLEIVWLVVFLILVAVFEELVFRGYIFNKLRRGYTGFRPFVLTAILFAVLHVPKYVVQIVTTVPFDPFYLILPAVQVPILIMSGLTFSAIRYYTGSIIVPMMTHFFWNFFTLLAQPVLEVISIFIMAPLIIVLVAILSMHTSFHLSWPLTRSIFPQSLESVDDYLRGFVARAEKFNIMAKRMQSSRSFTEGEPKSLPVGIVEGDEAVRGVEPHPRFVSLTESTRYNRRLVRYNYMCRSALWFHHAALLLHENQTPEIIPGLRSATKQLRTLYKLELRLRTLAGRLEYYLERQTTTGIPIKSIPKLQGTLERYRTRYNAFVQTLDQRLLDAING